MGRVGRSDHVIGIKSSRNFMRRGLYVPPTPPVSGRPATPSAFNATYDIAPSTTYPAQDGIKAAINTVPDGPSVTLPNRIRFPAGVTYPCSKRCEVYARNNLYIDGNGSTFTTTADKTNMQFIEGNWMVVGGTGITLKNIHTYGSFTAYDGQTRSLATISPDPAFTEAQMGFGIYGADTVWIEDCTASHQWGDGLTTGPRHYADPNWQGTTNYANNVFVTRLDVDTTGRHWWSPNSGNNIWIEHCSGTNSWYTGIDAEADNFSHPLQNQHYNYNTFSGYNNLGIFIPVAGDPGNTHDFEIRGNNFVTQADKICNSIIGVGGYPDSNPNMFYNVIVEDNTIRYGGIGIVLDHVNGGSVKNNTFNQNPGPNGSTWTGWCGYDVPVRVTNSTGVVVVL